MREIANNHQKKIIWSLKE